VLEKAKFLSSKLKEIGYNINFYGTPILSLVLKEDKKALYFRDKLLENNIFIQAIRPPTVPEGTARLRITLSYKHSQKDLENLIQILNKLYGEVGSHE
ncbi:MAG: aminotransferase class I/II-fold pyridoxal phosphate-dependent enzyme, partial [Aquificae bacterium]|nr:aminotransferase class I/II-fold pyridoxal phosphate-dependent enzyme [Aquificota bacterium]